MIHICYIDDVTGLKIGNDVVSTVTEAKDLGDIVDKNLTISSHVNQI